MQLIKSPFSIYERSLIFKNLPAGAGIPGGTLQAAGVGVLDGIGVGVLGGIGVGVLGGAGVGHPKNNEYFKHFHKTS